MPALPRKKSDTPRLKVFIFSCTAEAGAHALKAPKLLIEKLVNLELCEGLR